MDEKKSDEKNHTLVLMHTKNYSFDRMNSTNLYKKAGAPQHRCKISLCDRPKCSSEGHPKVYQLFRVLSSDVCTTRG